MSNAKSIIEQTAQLVDPNVREGDKYFYLAFPDFFEERIKEAVVTGLPVQIDFNTDYLGIFSDFLIKAVENQRPYEFRDKENRSLGIMRARPMEPCEPVSFTYSTKKILEESDDHGASRYYEIFIYVRMYCLVEEYLGVKKVSGTSYFTSDLEIALETVQNHKEKYAAADGPVFSLGTVELFYCSNWHIFDTTMAAYTVRHNPRDFIDELAKEYNNAESVEDASNACVYKPANLRKV